MWKIRYEKEVEDCTDCPMYSWDEDYYNVPEYRCWGSGKLERFTESPIKRRLCPIEVRPAIDKILWANQRE